MLSQADQKIVQDLHARLKEVAGELVQSVIVYGSRVWGQAGPDSDLDVALIIQGSSPEMENALQEVAYQVMWDYDFSPIIALKIFDAHTFLKYQELGYSFYRKVAQEGIAL
jgi:predicted nucleotidyltransferase